MMKILKIIGDIYCSRKSKSFAKFINLFKYLSSSANIGLQNVEPKKTGTMKEVNIKIKQKLGLAIDYTKEAQTRDHLLQYETKREELPMRTMSDSYVEATIPLSVCDEMRVKYISQVGTVRLGRLMEQLDLFAVWICLQHVYLPKLPSNEHFPYSFVTILVDKMMFSKLLPVYNEDIRLSGFVSWVGITSLEISMWLEQKHENEFRLITHAVFVMAARNATNTKAVPVNPLQPCDEQEKTILNLGELRRQTRKRLQETSIFKVKPSEEEHALIYDLFQNSIGNTKLLLNNCFLPNKCRWMHDSFVVNTLLSFPQNRNAQNTVFGGFLMRQSYEISWMCACLYCGHRPTCERSCDISFEKPVEISSITKMTAYIVYTEDRFMQIMTVAEILDPFSKSTITSNTFYYTFSHTDIVESVLPKTYHEALWYIHGRREFYNSMEKDNKN